MLFSLYLFFIFVFFFKYKCAHATQLTLAAGWGELAASLNIHLQASRHTFPPEVHLRHVTSRRAPRRHAASIANTKTRSSGLQKNSVGKTKRLQCWSDTLDIVVKNPTVLLSGFVLFLKTPNSLVSDFPLVAVVLPTAVAQKTNE